MNKKILPFLERDLSWLMFNYRVLQEAKDLTVPLLDRLKFVAIYSSNLEEFFKVRVAQIRRLVKTGKETKKQLNFQPEALLKSILNVVNSHQQELNKIFNQQILPELSLNGIFIDSPDGLTARQIDFVDDYFKEYLQAYIQPILLIDGKIKPFLNSGALYLFLHLVDKKSSKKQNQYAIVRLPSDQLPRFIILPENKRHEHHLMMLDDIVRLSVQHVFPGFYLQQAYSFKLTRDSELYIEDEYKGDLVAKIKKSLIKRNVGSVSRLVYDRTMPPNMLKLLQKTFSITNGSLIPEGKYHNNFDFFKFPDFGKSILKEAPLLPMTYAPIELADDIFEVISKGDHMIQVPYQKYESVIKFFEEASKDPQVTHIKVVQYRVAKESRIMDALMDAARGGKEVSVFIEVKARFDEEANLRWGEKLEKAGAKVYYSFPGLKVHSKIAWVRRKEGNRYKTYTYLSTGNFNEDTALIYSDYGLFSSDYRYTSEVKKIFDFLESGVKPKIPFKHLLVGKVNLREELKKLVEFEINEAKQKRPAAMMIKLNSLEDKEMITLFYKASQLGVKIKLIIRGISCISAGEKGLSENIEAISIVDRFLEHARVFIFNHGGKEKILLSSADFMERNLSFRIETAFPIFDLALKEKIKYVIDLQWKDNVKARLLTHGHLNEHRKKSKSILIRSQVETYNFYKEDSSGH
ncbi:MAG: polyphosphate kinase 1 [Saprospiraceae bacterium]